MVVPGSIPNMIFSEFNVPFILFENIKTAFTNLINSYGMYLTSKTIY